MDSYEFNLCVQRHNDIWTYIISQDFNEDEAEVLAMGWGDTPEHAVDLAMLEMKTLLVND